MDFQNWQYFCLRGGLEQKKREFIVNRKLHVVILTSVLLASAAAQTDSLNIYWDPNSEPDIHRYKLQRAVNSTGNFSDLATVNHPQTHVVDNSVQPGNLYVYRVAAIDSAGNMSLYSATAAAGIPQIQWQLAQAPGGQNTTVSRSSFLSDPDGNVNDLQLQVSQEDHVTVTVQNNSIILAPSPANYLGPASFLLRAQDAGELHDLKTVSFEFIEVVPVVFVVQIPDITFAEDGEFQIQLDNTVTHSNYSASQMSWSFSAGANLQHSYNSQARVLTVKSKNPHWFGQDQFIARATAPDQTSAADTFSVTITAVNDPPNISMQTLFVSPDPNANLIDLKQYATDVDNTPAELSWSFWGFSAFDVQWHDPGQKIIKIVPLPGASSETGTFRVADPANAADTAQVTIQLNAAPVFQVNIPDAYFDEDQTFSIQMDTTLAVSNYTPAQISWSFLAGPNLKYTYSAGNRELALQSKLPDWYGSDRMIAIATAPDQSTRVDTFQVTIRPVNDPPHASIQNLFVSSQSSNLVDLKAYATDADNTPYELTWEFWGYSQFTIQWQNQSEKIIRIIPSAGATSETGNFRVRDPQGASDTRQVAITYTETNTPPRLFFHPTLTMGEDSLLVLNLVNFVVDSTNTIGELSWEFSGGANLNLEYDPAAYTLSILPERDWYGQSFFNVTVRDPEGLSDEQQVAVTVENRNDLRNLSFHATAGGGVAADIQMEIPSTVEFTYWRELSQIITIRMTQFQTRHTFDLANIQADTVYHFNVYIRDEKGGSIVIEDSVFSTGSLSAPLARTTSVVVYPNPVKTARGQNEMIFTNMPPEARTISLYSIMGERIYEQALSQPALAEHRINVVNGGVDIPSGMYIYMLRGEGSRVLDSGRIVIIR